MAKLILQAKNIEQLDKMLEPGAPKAIPGAIVRTEDGALYCFATDGSLRHANGRKPDKAERKRLKRERRRFAAVKRKPTFTIKKLED